MKSCPGLSVNPVRHSTRQAVYARCAWKQFAEHGRDKNERTSLTSSTMRISSLSSSKVTCHEMPLSNMSHLETCWVIDFFVNFCGLISLYIGRQRVKKRTRSVVKTATLQVSNQLKGTFVEYEQYKKD